MRRASVAVPWGPRASPTTKTYLTMATLYYCGLLLLVMAATIDSAFSRKFDVMAFDYIQKFSSKLELGQCPNRTVDFHGQSLTKSCTKMKYGLPSKSDDPRNDTRNVLLQSHSDLLVYTMLCDGDSASFLGLLSDRKDCHAVNIAKELSFNRKSYIRGYIEYYRKALDVLEAYDWNPPEEFSEYFKEDYYLRDRSYGTLEIIIVELQYRKTSLARKAKTVTVSSDLMSDYLERVGMEVGEPKQIKVIRLSTADSQYDTRTLRGREFGEALALVGEYQYDIRRIRKQIDSERTNPHLTYGFLPFLKPGAEKKLRQYDEPYRTSTSMETSDWEKATLLDIYLDNAISISTRTVKKCRRSSLKTQCSQVQSIDDELKSLQREVHVKRSTWYTLTRDEQHELATRHKQVASYGRKLKRLAKIIRQMQKTARKQSKSKKSKKNSKKQ